MAITAKFLADFSEMVASVKQAEASLKGLEGQGKKLESSFDDVIGVAKKLGIAFSVGAVLNFGRELVAAADALQRLHDQTGVSVENLQRFQVAGDDAGNTLDELTTAITKMEDKLSSGDKSALTALENIGIAFEDIKNLSPEDQFIAISDAIRGMEDPAKQVNAAIDLFGKQGATILPTLKRGFDDVKDSTAGMSEETVRTLDQAGDAWDKYYRKAKAVASTGIALTLGAIFDPLGAQRWTAAIDGATAAAEKAAPKMKALAVPGLPADLKEIEDGLKDEAEAIKKANDALKPFNDAMIEVNSAGVSWQGTLDTIDGSVVEAIKFYEAAGVSQKALATAYGLTDTQVKSVGKSIQAEADATREAAAEHDRLAKSAMDAADALEKEREAAEKIKKETQAATAAIEALKKANREMGNSTQFDLSTESGRAAVPEGIRVWLHDGYSLAQAAQIDFLMRWGLPINANDPLFAHKGPRVPGFASGVENFAGGLALVGERGPELVNLPSGSDVIPMGKGGGVVNNFYLVDNSENLARKTAQLILASMKRGKQLGMA